MNKPNRQVIGVVLFAAVAGYIAGILTAPKSGKETRQDIKLATNRAISEAENRLKFAYSELSQLLALATERVQEISGKAKTELEAMVSKASIAKEKVRQVISSVHEGEASDEDLDAAVKDAEKTIDHLKKFLDKE